MANNAFAAIKLTGGTAGALDDIIHTNISDADIAFVCDHINEKFYVLTYDSSSSTDETTIANQIVIKPDSNGGTGRWIGVAVQSALWDNLRTALAATDLDEFLTGLALKYDHIWIPAAAMIPTDTNGAEQSTYEYATNDIMANYLAFDSTTEEYATFDLVMPSTWDKEKIKFKAYWSSATGSSTGDAVEWELSAVAVGNDDALDATLGTVQVISDALTADNGADLQVSGASPEITVGGTPALGDLIRFKISRNVGGNDNMTEDAWLFGIVLQIAYTSEVSAW